MARMKVSGNIVEELSEKIPTYLVAINELIKNSFDAFSNNVKIKFNSIEKILSISDDGNGMDRNDIDILLHISKSNKEYAKLVNGRYIQGSKGLGFLSVFKFGESVSWSTNTNSSGKGYEFKVHYNDIIESENLEDVDIPILEKEGIPKGTLITISMTDESTSLFKEELSKPQTIDRLLHSFSIEEFHVELEIDNKKYYNANPMNFNSILPKRQLFNVKYNSNDSKLVFYHNNVKAMEYDFTFEYNDFNIDLDLIIFSLKAHDKKKINSLFYDNRRELTPLIYINTNLFNNYTLFDTSIMQQIKYSSIMNQIIGNINIYSNNQDLDFNSDRTQFVQNKLTTNVTNFIERINIFIQEKASEHKKYLIDFNILKKNKVVIDASDIKKKSSEQFKDYIKADFMFKEKLNAKLENNIVTFSLFNRKTNLKIEFKKDDIGKDTPPTEGNNGGHTDNIKNKTTQSPQPQKAIIILKEKYLKVHINSGQIDLKTFITSATDSCGNSINIDLINISCKFGSCTDGILSSQSKAYKEYVVYLYKDPITGEESKSLTIEFIDTFNSNFNFKDNPKRIIPNPIKNGYTLDADTSFKNLTKQINDLNPEKYYAVIACSIRSIFELGSNDLYSINKYPKIKFDSNLPSTIGNIIEYAKNDNKLLSFIDKNTNLGYKNLKDNILIRSEFESAISLAHKGAHKSDQFLKTSELEGLGVKASYFIILINEMMKYK